jgi:hypothetical protein
MTLAEGVNGCAAPGVLDEKCSATAALGAYADACPQAFMAYAEDSLAALSDMCHYWHDEARAAAYDSLQKLTLATHRAFPPSTAASQRSPAEQQHGNHNGQAPHGTAVPVVLSQQAKLVCNTALPLLTSPVEDDINKPAVAAAAAALVQLLKGLGPGAVVPDHLQAAAHMAQLLLQGQALCQVVDNGQNKLTIGPGIQSCHCLVGCCRSCSELFIASHNSYDNLVQFHPILSSYIHLFIQLSTNGTKTCEAVTTCTSLVWHWPVGEAAPSATCLLCVACLLLTPCNCCHPRRLKMMTRQAMTGMMKSWQQRMRSC